MENNADKNIQFIHAVEKACNEGKKKGKEAADWMRNVVKEAELSKKLDKSVEINKAPER